MSGSAGDANINVVASLESASQTIDTVLPTEELKRDTPWLVQRDLHQLTPLGTLSVVVQREASLSL